MKLAGEKEPGTTWKYSADGHFYLQRVVEHLKGGTLDALMQKEVLDPLGMTRSAMVWRPAFESVMASGHGLLGRPEATRRRMEAHAGASLYTTAGDYATFLCAVLNGEGLALWQWGDYGVFRDYAIAYPAAGRASCSSRTASTAWA